MSPDKSIGQNLAALIAGLIFGFGLILSGMADPANVLGFLDITGHWRPQLAFVMGGAILVSAPAFAWMRRRNKTLIDGTPVTLPNRWPLDRNLVIGAAIFGIGWGLSGLCPGPALVAAAGGSLPAVVFAAAMAAGMWVSARLRERTLP